MSEALRQVVWKCDRCGGDAQAIFGIFPSCKCGSTSFKAAQPPAPTAQPATEDDLRVYDAIAAGYAQPVQQPGAEADGRLHADGYFTWKRRDGYVLDAKLPCDFYLAAPAQRQPLSDERIEQGAAEAGYNVYKLTAFVEGARFAEAAHNVTAVPAAQKGETP